jgi:hypothetical protein
LRPQHWHHWTRGLAEVAVGPLRHAARSGQPEPDSGATRGSLGAWHRSSFLELEQRRLGDQDRSDPARKIRWVSREDGDGAGFDILSFDSTGTERMIEVKTTCGGTTPFYVTRNELGLATERPDAFRLYRLYSFAKAPRLFQLAPPLDASVRLDPLAYRASFE